MPEKGVSIHVEGLCSHILPSGIVVINIDKLLFHFGFEHLPSKHPCLSYIYVSKLIPDLEQITDSDEAGQSQI